jgi:hypothetical protein
VKAHTATGHLIKPRNNFDKQQSTLQTAGEILNYPYSFDIAVRDEEVIALDNKLAKQRFEEQYRIAEI